MFNPDRGANNSRSQFLRPCDGMDLPGLALIPPAKEKTAEYRITLKYVDLSTGISNFEAYRLAPRSHGPPWECRPASVQRQQTSTMHYHLLFCPVPFRLASCPHYVLTIPAVNVLPSHQLGNEESISFPSLIPPLYAHAESQEKPAVPSAPAAVER